MDESMKMDMAGSDSAVECDWDKVRRKKRFDSESLYPKHDLPPLQGCGGWRAVGCMRGMAGHEGCESTLRELVMMRHLAQGAQRRKQ